MAIINILIYFYLVFFYLFIHKRIYGGYFSITIIPFQFSSVAQSCPTLCDPMDYTVHGILWARVLEWGAFTFSQDLLNPGLLHCRRVLYQLSHRGSPRILVWVAYPFSSGSSRPRNRTGISCVADGFFTN